MSKSVWLMLDSRSNGGIESHVLTLAQALVQQGLDVSVILWQRYGQAHPIEAMLAPNHIKLRVLNGSVLDFIWQVQAHRPHVIHTHGYKAGIIARLFKPYLDYRLIASFHAGEHATGKLGLYDVLDRYSARLADARIAVSETIARRVSGACHFIENFVHLPRFEQQEQHLKEIAFVGRLSPEKGPERFIELAQQFPMLTFSVYGDGPLANELRANAPSNVIFHGMVVSMNPFWSNIELLCMPSLYEGLPMAALEAMAHGVPVMASPVGELPKLIQQGENGWLIEQADTARWRLRLSEWLSLPLLKKQQCHRAARNTIESGYSSQSQLPKYLKLYQMH